MEVCVLDTRSPMYFFFWWSRASEEAQGLHRQVTDGVSYKASPAQANRLAAGLRRSTCMQLLGKI